MTVRTLSCGRLGPPFLLLLLLVATPVWADESVWARLREGGLVVMIRHATAPGVGDPPGFRLGDCATQRNLSEEGRAEARRIGEAFRRERVPVAEVRASEWCRCRDTAQLAFGRYTAWPALNSFFADRGTADAQTAQVLALRPREGANIVLVTHQVNITAASGVYPASGEMIVLQPADSGRFTVLGRMQIR